LVKLVSYKNGKELKMLLLNFTAVGTVEVWNSIYIANGRFLLTNEAPALP